MLFLFNRKLHVCYPTCPPVCKYAIALGVTLIQTDNESHSEEQGTIVLTTRHQTAMQEQRDTSLTGKVNDILHQKKRHFCNP